MPINKNALQRYIVIDKCLRNTYKKHTITDLVEACCNALLDINPNSCGVSKRTIYCDLEFMQDSTGYNADILKIKEGRHVYYSYAQPNYSINNSLLSAEEANNLSLVVESLSRFEGLPQFDWLPKLKEQLQEELGFINDSEKIIYFDSNEYLRGKSWLATLFHNIHNKQPLKILYKPLTKEEQVIFIHPYILKEYNNRWFLFGYNTDYKGITNLALDRIEFIGQTNLQYIESDIDWEEYFYDIKGVSFPKDQPIEQVVLSVKNTILPLIDTKPIHGSQKIGRAEQGWTKVSLKLIINNELYRSLLGFGSDILIIEPMSLRDKVIENSARLIHEYQSCEDRLHT